MFILNFVVSCYDCLNRTLQKYKEFRKSSVLFSPNDRNKFAKLFLVGAN